MRICYAAALALAGWYLMTPPADLVYYSEPPWDAVAIRSHAGAASGFVPPTGAKPYVPKPAPSAGITGLPPGFKLIPSARSIEVPPGWRPLSTGSPVPPTFDPHLALFRWRIRGSYDSAKECEQGKRELFEKGTSYWDLWAECVETSDPRLKLPFQIRVP